MKEPSVSEQVDSKHTTGMRSCLHNVEINIVRPSSF